MCFSGGKDSCVIKALADMAGVQYDAHYSNTGIDPPELVRFIKDYHKDVIFENPVDKNGKRITMWNLIPKKKMPPTRLVRYCCKELKEEGGKGRFVITGVRWAESTNRKNTHGMVDVRTNSKEMEQSPHFKSNGRGGLILNNDNDEARKMLDSCYKQRKTTLNPIIDWTDDEVWEFLKEYEIPYCTLYDKGYKRLGCIGCPMSTRQGQELDAYPKYKALYLRAFDEMLEERRRNDLPMGDWENGQDVMDWWLSGGKLKNRHDRQYDMSELMAEYEMEGK